MGLSVVKLLVKPLVKRLSVMVLLSLVGPLVVRLSEGGLSVVSLLSWSSARNVW